MLRRRERWSEVDMVPWGSQVLGWGGRIGGRKNNHMRQGAWINIDANIICGHGRIRLVGVNHMYYAACVKNLIS